jgi:hypothetical protein
MRDNTATCCRPATSKQQPNEEEARKKSDHQPKRSPQGNPIQSSQGSQETIQLAMEPGPAAASSPIGSRTGAAVSSSSLIFLGTGCSAALPDTRCLIKPAASVPPCAVCSTALSLPPDQNPNYRCVSKISRALLAGLCVTCVVRDADHGMLSQLGSLDP